MLTTQRYTTYASSTTFYFSFEDITDAEAPFTGVAPLTADIWVSKDGAAPANATNGMTAIGNGIYSWVATSAEVSGIHIIVSIYDATASAIFKPLTVFIDTKIFLSSLVLDASSLTNTEGLLIKGSGTGSGIYSIGGATGVGMTLQGGATSGAGLAVGAINGNSNGVNFFSVGSGSGIYASGGTTGNGAAFQGGSVSGSGLNASAAAGNSNGAQFAGVGTGNGINAAGGATGNGIAGAGTGIGQGFFGSGLRPSNFLDEALEDITGAPTPGVTTFRQGLAALVARMYYLVTQTTTQQKQYASDSATLRGTSVVSDDGVTQTKGRSV